MRGGGSVSLYCDHQPNVHRSVSPLLYSEVRSSQPKRATSRSRRTTLVAVAFYQAASGSELGDKQAKRRAEEEEDGTGGEE
jgi:hypothetical protein